MQTIRESIDGQVISMGAMNSKRKIRLIHKIRNIATVLNLLEYKHKIDSAMLRGEMVGAI